MERILENYNYLLHMAECENLEEEKLLHPAERLSEQTFVS